MIREGKRWTDLSLYSGQALKVYPYFCLPEKVLLKGRTISDVNHKTALVNDSDEGQYLRLLGTGYM